MAPLNDEDRENLIAYLDGELDEQTAKTVEARLNLDPKTRAEADALMQAWSMLDYLPRTEPSPNFTHRTLERLDLRTGASPRPGWSPWIVGLGWAAALLLAAGAGFGAARLIWRQPAEVPGVDDQMVRHLHVIEKIRLFNQVDDMEFLHALEVPDLFGLKKSGL